MASNPTKNPVPSENYDDLRFNAGKLDEFVTSPGNNYTDRLGITHLTARGLQNSVAGALLPANNLSDVSNKDTSLTNLGGGTTGIAVFKAGTAAAVRSAIASAASGSNADITELTALSTALSISQGGTGGKTANAARTNLGIGTLGAQNASAVAITGGSIAGINDLAIADGGTGASSAATARVNLGAKADTGVTDASSASAGQVGEVLSATGTSTSLTTSTATQLVSLSLTAGDWEVSGSAQIVPTGATYTSISIGINTATPTVPVFPDRYQLVGSVSGGDQHVSPPKKRVNVSSTTTVYLNLSAGFSGGTSTAIGYLFARRIR